MLVLGYRLRTPQWPK